MIDRRSLVAAAPALLIPGRALAQGAPIVETSAGKIEGVRERGVAIFRGIPYGASTTGPGRFAPPRPVQPWTGVREAKAFGPMAPQMRLTAGRPRMSDAPLVNGQEQSEDCLVLNIWTPAPDRAKRPVMVWLHGGNFTAGSGSTIAVEGANLARNHDVVAITLNHRLNVMGFLDLSWASPDFAQSGNVGMLDLVQALQWVRDNIERFGGDPNRVMIFGESGGGRKTATMMSMPGAKGLFHRAAIQSAAQVRNRTPAEARVNADAMLAELGLTAARVPEIRPRPLERIMEASFKVSRDGKGGYMPVVGGPEMPRHPFDPDAPAVSADVPMIIGYNRQDISYITANIAETFTLDEAGLKRRALAMFEPADADRVIARYRADYPKLSPSDLYFLIGTDQWLGIASMKMAERKAALRKAPAYLYRFDWPTPVDGGKWRSPHTLEVPYVFDNVREPALAGVVGPNPDVALARRMSAAWAAFARTGDPNHAGMPKWTPYGVPQRPQMIFDTHTRQENDPTRAQRVLMDEIVFKTSGGRGDRALAAAR